MGNLTDEMNMHCPQTLESVVELRLLASVPTQIVSPQASKPVMGLAQDSLLGICLLSQRKDLTQQEMMKLICSVSAFHESLSSPIMSIPDPRWTSQQLISLFMPQITYKKDPRPAGQAGPPGPVVVSPSDLPLALETQIAEEKRGRFEVVAGQVKAGIFDSNTVGKKNGSLFHIAWDDYGPIACRDLFNDMSFAANMWLQIQGFSCGISDCIIPQADLRKITEAIKDARLKASDLIEMAKLGRPPKGENIYSFKKDFAKKILEVMGKCRTVVEEQTTKSIRPDNSINTMIQCGSKGSKNNMSQIVGMLGQQEIDASWIENQIYRRTLPHFCKDDLRPDAHGFIESSFMTGLNPAEYWFHAQEGRIGVISKAIKTADTGYIQRKLIKILEDLHVCYDGTVRNANNMIIETVYGSDGFDASYLETQSMFFINYNMEKLCVEFKHYDVDEERLKSSLTAESYAQFTRSAERYQLLDEEFQQIVTYYRYLKENVPRHLIYPEVRCPVNFKRLILNTINQFKLADQVTTDLNPVYIVTQLKSLRDRLVIDPSKERNFMSTVIFNSLLSIYLSSKSLIYKHHLSKEAFDHLIELIYMGFMRSLVHPGENVGIIAAQSLGEPTTQMALSTLHYTGQGSRANISRGTPRLKELLAASRHPKTRSLTIYVDEDYFIQTATNDKMTADEVKETNLDRISQIGADIEYTVLRDLLRRTEIFYDPLNHASCIHEDQEFIDSYYDLLPESEKESLSELHWLLRLEFDPEAMMRKHIPMFLVEQKINEAMDQAHTVIVSDDNAQKLVCRIKVECPSADVDPINYVREIEYKLMSIQIKGIKGIDQCFVNSSKKDITLPNGTVVSPLGSEKDYEEAKKRYNYLKYYLNTNGANLIDVLPLPHIDIYQTVSNDVWEIYELYGIEAARKSIIDEINMLLEFNGTYIQDRHINLLVDAMTNQGSVVSVDRHGVNKTESGPLHRASFEETTAQLTSASLFSEVDPMTGVSANIMFGQFIQTGTNAFRIALDLDKLKKQKVPEQPLVLQQRQVAHVAEPLDLTKLCLPENFDFDFKLGGVAPQ